MKPASDLPGVEITSIPAHVTATEEQILNAIQIFQIKRHPQLTPQDVDFLCAPWIHFFSHSAIHIIESAQELSCPDSGKIINEKSPVPGDTLAFMEFFRTSSYREYLEKTLSGKSTQPEIRTKSFILQPVFRHAHTVAFMSCLPRRFRYLLPLLSFGRIRFLDNNPIEKNVEADSKSRKELARLIEITLRDSNIKHCGWLATRAAELFPKSLLENLGHNLKEKQQLPPLRNLFSSDGWHIIDDWKIFALAQKIKNDTTWIGCPNAISHGCLTVFWQRDFEIRHMDHYLTWGWSKKMAPNVRPFYSPHYAGKHLGPPVSTANANGILISSAARPLHLLEYPYTPARFKFYLKSQMQLACHAQKETGMNVAIRTRPRDLGWDVSHMVRSLNIPEITLEFQGGKFTDRLKDCRLHICDNCSTTIIDSLSANHPTLIMINNDYFDIKPDAYNEFRELALAGIFHTTASSLLYHISQIKNDIDGWWKNKKTQDAIGFFLGKQGHLGGELNNWKNALLVRTFK